VWADVVGQVHFIFSAVYVLLVFHQVLDCSDVVIEVLDARDPMGTRCQRVEKYLAKEKPHKHLIFVLNKVDLVPTSVTVSTLSHFALIIPKNVRNTSHYVCCSNPATFMRAGKPVSLLSSSLVRLQPLCILQTPPLFICFDWSACDNAC